MLKIIRFGLAFTAGLALAIVAVAPLDGHHGPTVKFDPNQSITLEGRVTMLEWTNPHAHIYMVVSEGEGLTPWYIELESPVDLEASGWRRDALTPGDRITVRGMASRDGSPQAWGSSIVLTDTGQSVLAVSPPDAVTSSGRPTPRWPDNQPRLGPPPGESGYWRPRTTVMMEAGVDVPMEANGQLRDPADAARVAPFQPWALGIYELRQSIYLASDPMYLTCKPPGGPRKFQVTYGVQFVEDRTFERIFFLNGGGNHDWHFIYTNDRPFRGHGAGDDGNLLYYGQARGRWVADTFVVESRDFSEKFWFTNGGLPHTEQLELTERFTRTDLDTLVYEVRVNDPGAYTRPWTATWELDWIAGEELPQYYCQDVRP
jgi:hypothetical protein